MRFTYDKDNFQQTYEKSWKTLRSQMHPVSSELHQRLMDKCQKNPWLKLHGLPFEDDPDFEADSPYVFSEIRTIEILEMFFDHGNWSIRQGVVHRDMVFINQVNGGDEWWALKQDGNSYISIESVSFKPMIRGNRFKKYISRLRHASVEACKNQSFLGRRRYG